ncbi:microfibril-associated glycoprotein 4-like [Glandiceps talaboti]
MALKLTPLLVLYSLVMTNTLVFVTSQSTLGQLLHIVTQRSVLVQELTGKIQEQSLQIQGLSNQIQDQSVQLQNQSVQIQQQSVQIQELSVHHQDQNVLLQEVLKLQQNHTCESKPKETILKDCGYMQISTGGYITQRIHQIQPTGISSPFDVYCEVSNSRVWTVIQRRLDGSVNFTRNWEDYKTGFGNIDGEYWLGNDNIYALTNQATYKLRIDLEDWDGTTSYAEYDQFWIEDEANDYTLHVGEYSGNAGDSLNYGSHYIHNGESFSTYDRDNDMHSINCARTYKSGWWYNACIVANLNGPYLSEGQRRGVKWYSKEYRNVYSRKKATMKVMKTE